MNRPDRAAGLTEAEPVIEPFIGSIQDKQRPSFDCSWHNPPHVSKNQRVSHDGWEQVGGIRPLSDAGSVPARDPLNTRAAQRPAKENEAWRPHSGEMYGPGLNVKSRLWDKRVTSSGPNSSLGSRHAACRQAFRLTGRQVRAVAPRRCPSAVHSAAVFSSRSRSRRRALSGCMR
jgi:hypothetical protein